MSEPLANLAAIDGDQRGWLIDAADLLAAGDPGPTPWLVDGLIVDQALVAIVGKWKTTKSYGVLDLCIAIATGRPAFGKLDVPNPGPVIFVNEESGQRALWRRLDALCRGRAIDGDELRGRLHVAANARVKLDDPSSQNDLLDIGAELKPRLMVFDPLARMKDSGRDENEQKGMAELIEFMRHLRDETGSAIGFVHHTGHNGAHMRGSSDLESAWETRLSWHRDGQSTSVRIESEHRESESAGDITYGINWDGETRTMRFELEHDPLEDKIRAYLADHPDASANEIHEHVKGNRKKTLALVKTIREGGSSIPEPPRNHPRPAPPEGGSPSPLFRGAGTTTQAPGSSRLEPPLAEDAELLRFLDTLDVPEEVT